MGGRDGGHGQSQDKEYLHGQRNKLTAALLTLPSTLTSPPAGSI